MLGMSTGGYCEETGISEKRTRSWRGDGLATENAGDKANESLDGDRQAAKENLGDEEKKKMMYGSSRRLILEYWRDRLLNSTKAPAIRSFILHPHCSALGT
jgi:hypothetical protein